MRLEADSTGNAAFFTGGLAGLTSGSKTILELHSGFSGLAGGVDLGVSVGVEGLAAIFLFLIGGSPLAISLSTSQGKEVEESTVTVGLLRSSSPPNSDKVGLGGAGRSQSSSSGATTVRL